MLLLSSLVKQRKTCLAISGFVGLHLMFVMLQLPSWQCPIRAVLGIPCPGCGLSRSIAALLRGDWQRSLEIHAFAPVAIALIVLIITASLLPTASRRKLSHSLEQFERQTGMSAIGLSSFLGYWLIRLLFFTKQLYRFVM